MPAQPSRTPWPTAAWPTGELADADPTGRVEELLDRAFPDPPGEPYGATLALVVVHRGQLVAERYGVTTGPDEALISWSMAKSVTHALVGVLVKGGALRLQHRAPVPEWADPEDPRHPITLDHLLRMVPGTEFNEDYLDETNSHCIEMLFGSGQADMAAYTAMLPRVAAADSVFNYSSGTTNLITRAMADIVGSGEVFEAWMRRALFNPIGMSSATPGFDGAGTWVGSSFLNATARDFAKFGLLYQRDGVWDGERLLPEGWVDQARTVRAHADDGRAYGSHWWIWDEEREVFAAQGYETQRILVDPASDVVVVRLGKTPSEKAPAVDAWLAEILDCF
ncbi:MAG: serine hydrolase domain-containing protein [Acidimicrobiales bacterium]